MVVVSGYEIRDPDLNVEGAIEGVTLSLKKAEPGTTTSMSIAIDNAGIRDKVGRFVSAYNVLANQISKLRAYNPDTKVAGPLLGDALLRGIESQVSRLISDPVAAWVRLPIPRSRAWASRASATGCAEARQHQVRCCHREGSLCGQSAVHGREWRCRPHDRLHRSPPGGYRRDLAARDATMKARGKVIDEQKQALEEPHDGLPGALSQAVQLLDSLLTQMQTTSSYLTQQLVEPVELQLAIDAQAPRSAAVKTPAKQEV